MAITRFDYKCPTCKAILLDVEAPIGSPPGVTCELCEIPMQRYFGATRETTINFGFRESRFANTTDADIAKFQFQNL